MHTDHVVQTSDLGGHLSLYWCLKEWQEEKNCINASQLYMFSSKNNQQEKLICGQGVALNMNMTQILL